MINKLSQTKDDKKDVYNLINKVNEIIDSVESKHDPYTSVGSGIRGVKKPDKTVSLQMEIDGAWYEVSLTEIGRQ